MKKRRCEMQKSSTRDEWVWSRKQQITKSTVNDIDATFATYSGGLVVTKNI